MRETALGTVGPKSCNHHQHQYRHHRRECYHPSCLIDRQRFHDPHLLRSSEKKSKGSPSLNEKRDIHREDVDFDFDVVDDVDFDFAVVVDVVVDVVVVDVVVVDVVVGADVVAVDIVDVIVGVAVVDGGYSERRSDSLNRRYHQ